MIGRVYTVVFGNVSVSLAQDLFSLAPAANRPIEIIGMKLTQVGNADVGDAQEEMLRLQIIRGHATVGSGGTAPTPRPSKRGDAAAGFTARVNDTTIASVGSPVTLEEDAFNVRAGLASWWPVGAEIDATASDTLLVVRLPTAPADAIALSGTLYVREYG